MTGLVGVLLCYLFWCLFLSLINLSQRVLASFWDPWGCLFIFGYLFVVIHAFSGQPAFVLLEIAWVVYLFI